SDKAKNWCKHLFFPGTLAQELDVFHGHRFGHVQRVRKRIGRPGLRLESRHIRRLENVFVVQLGCAQSTGALSQSTGRVVKHVAWIGGVLLVWCIHTELPARLAKPTRQLRTGGRRSRSSTPKGGISGK